MILRGLVLWSIHGNQPEYPLAIWRNIVIDVGVAGIEQLLVQPKLHFLDSN